MERGGGGRGTEEGGEGTKGAREKMGRRVRLGERKDEGERERDRGIHSRSLCTSLHSMYLIQLPDLYILQTSEGRRRDSSGTGGRGR